MIPLLDAAEVRVLGCLIEKEVTTPEYYPLTANALVNACNQKSNRDPVVLYDEGRIQDMLNSLRQKHLITVLTGGGNRVPKYGHRLQEKLNLGRREMAILCELMVRGPQTLGELRDRAGRMHTFSDTDEVERCLSTLSGGEQPLVTRLERQPGTKEPRYAHLLSGADAIVEPPADGRRSATFDRRGDLAAELSELKDRVSALEEELRRFKEQLGA
jgi:uncharacterized protein YceH (UPF0502 family)